MQARCYTWKTCFFLLSLLSPPPFLSFTTWCPPPGFFENKDDRAHLRSFSPPFSPPLSGERFLSGMRRRHVVEKVSRKRLFPSLFHLRFFFFFKRRQPQLGLAEGFIFDRSAGPAMGCSFFLPPPRPKFRKDSLPFPPPPLEK